MQTRKINDVNLNSKSWRKCSHLRRRYFYHGFECTWQTKLKLGVQAPKEVSVHREEIYQRILQSKDEHIDGAS